MVRRIEGLQLSVMIRPRGGDFLYTDVEFEQMIEEIGFAREYGADGVVFGLLTADGRVDIPRTKTLVAASKGMQTTFHRAFDMVRNQSDALEDVIGAGCTRILTSGGCNTAQEGIETLRGLVTQAAGRIEIMAGSGVNHSNARLLAATGVDALHFSARGICPSGMTYRNPNISMGGCAGVPEYDLLCADEMIIRQILNRLYL
jgi:copper homeostasis protein